MVVQGLTLGHLGLDALGEAAVPQGVVTVGGGSQAGTIGQVDVLLIAGLVQDQLCKLLLNLLFEFLGLLDGLVEVEVAVVPEVRSLCILV